MSAPQFPSFNLGSPVNITARAASLRTRIEQARTTGRPFAFDDAGRWLVEICVQAADLHAQGVPLRLHPSNIVEDQMGRFVVATEHPTKEPANDADRACTAPELQPGQPGNARASVYAVGAMLYELITLERVGTGMKRPTDLVADLPENLEAVLGKALVTNPTYRPDDLNALAQALHHLLPEGTVPPPPPADEHALDAVGDFSVDVSLSLLPPALKGPPPGSSPLGSSPLAALGTPGLPALNLGGAMNGLNVGVVHTPTPPSGDRATNELTALKQRLQADPTPHYVVVKDGMDHGPFTAVELLQQIAANTFVDEDVVRDTAAGTLETIAESANFAPFAEHARRHRDIKQEKEAILHVVRLESKSTRSKTLAGMAILGVLLAGAGVWFLTQVGARNDQITVKADKAVNVEAEGNLNVPLKKKGSRVTGTQNGIPILAGGMSCEAAINAYVEEIKIGGQAQADITQGQYAAIMNNGSYFAGCGVPSSMGLNICAAVQNGRAVGVTVVTNPSSPGVASCVAGGVRRLSFPAHPKLDVVRVSF